ncbi:DUF732 domain-containing protein [Mycolicibacillus trivialis]|uniref:DUF732 domain-containing protein n=1 Tax=Mycolicibacillus trivialis TaxID=1798 RepID=A0A1X2EFJ5_9MYCO|nr:DUF732 domain-containing protein [Mycolicibacillus trivialis]ORX00136.1 hypothetical protein AWC30_15855 [Mycolicibacillus trivialis]
MHTLRTAIVVGATAAGLAGGGLLSGAAVAHANEYTYLSDLRAAGVFIHTDAVPYVLQQAFRACRDLRDGVPPDVVGSQFPVGSGVAPAPDPNVYLDILQRNMCPNALK